MTEGLREIEDATLCQARAQRLQKRLEAMGVPPQGTLVYVLTALGGKRPGFAEPLMKLIEEEVG